MRTATTTKPVVFQDWDIQKKKTIFRKFPAGQRVVDILRPSNPRKVRCWAIMDTEGWIADIPNDHLAR